MPDKRCDIAIIGGGILGVATALELSLRFPRYKILILEKEPGLAAHQTGHNSGVIHSGIYYKPGSLKAKNCVIGSNALIKFCDQNEIPYQLCGKVIIATKPGELSALEELHRRGKANGVAGLELIGPERLQELEPHASGIKALYSPHTGIVDYVQVTKGYAHHVQNSGGEISHNTRVLNIKQNRDTIQLETTAGDVMTSYLINCAGLQADLIANKLGVSSDVRIIPFRGEYYMISPQYNHLVNGLIYPVPDPSFPFLGVHYTRTIYGEIEAGPNAVLAFAREGYTFGTFNTRELLGTIAFPGFWAMAAKYWKTGALEFYRSLSKDAFVKALQKLVPSIKKDYLTKGGAGVRAQAVHRDGSLLDDFSITETRNAIHVRNAPSPGATASIAISRDIVGMAEKSFDLSI